MNGDVRLRVEGLMLERLIQRALNEGARFRHIERTGPRTLVLETDPAGAAVMTRLCERFSISCAVIDHRGRDAMLRRLKQRSTLLAGMLVCLTVVSLFLSRVWLIDVELTGNRAASVQSVEQALERLGVRPVVTEGSFENIKITTPADLIFAQAVLEGRLQS